MTCLSNPSSVPSPESSFSTHSQPASGSFWASAVTPWFLQPWGHHQLPSLHVQRNLSPEPLGPPPGSSNSTFPSSALSSAPHLLLLTWRITPPSTQCTNPDVTLPFGQPRFSDSSVTFKLPDLGPQFPHLQNGMIIASDCKRMKLSFTRDGSTEHGMP